MEHSVNKDAREKRWLVVSADGRHGTLGRHTDPSAAEIERAGARLDELGLAGWLVVSEGVYYSDGPVTLLQVRRISAADGDWDEAAKLWHATRAAAQG